MTNQIRLCLAVLAMLIVNNSFAGGIARITIHADKQSSDTLFASVYTSFLKEFSADTTLTAIRGKSGDYIFEIPINQTFSYLNLFFYRSQKGQSSDILRYFLMEPGDNVHIQLTRLTTSRRFFTPVLYYHHYFGKDQFDIACTGRGADKYNARYSVDTFLMTHFTDRLPPMKKDRPMENANLDAALRQSVKILSTYRQKITQPAYQQLLFDLKSSIELERIKCFSIVVDTLLKDTKFRELTLSSFAHKIEQLQTPGGHNPERSPYYAELLNEYYMLIVLSNYEGHNAAFTPNFPELFARLHKLRISPEIYNMSVARFIYKNNKLITDYAVFDSLISRMNERYKKMLGGYYSLFPGGQAPDFDLYDYAGNRQKLSSYRGKLVFIDFWYIGCAPCALYYKFILSKLEQEYAEKDIVFMTINVDIDKQRWKSAVESGVYTNTSIINLNTGDKGASHPVIVDYAVNGYPKPILIGRDGKIICNDKYILRKEEGLRKQIEDALKIN